MFSGICTLYQKTRLNVRFIFSNDEKFKKVKYWVMCRRQRKRQVSQFIGDGCEIFGVFRKTECFHHWSLGDDMEQLPTTRAQLPK